MSFSYTLLLVIITVAVSFYAYEKRDLFERLMFKPYIVRNNSKESFRLFTHAFIHADIFHLVFNMIVLYYYGEPLEKYFLVAYGKLGYYYFILLYFGGILFATLPGMINHKNNSTYASLGASGGTSALVFSFIALQPMKPGPAFFMLPIAMPAIIFGIVFIGLEYFLMKRGGTGVAHNAHIFGALYGFAFTLLIDHDNLLRFIAQLKSGF